MTTGFRSGTIITIISKLVWIALVGIGSIFLSASHATAKSIQPNIILILTDDQTTESYDFLPFLQSIKKQALILKQYYHSLSLCCPSRTSMLTGMYPHNHGVLNNHGKDGGYSKFESLGLEHKTWSKLLSDNGYKTAMLGKFLNGYPPGSTYVPVGWSRWFVGYGNGQVAFNYSINSDGNVLGYGNGDRNYFTNVISDEAHKLIVQQPRDRRPLAILFSPHCPHLPSTPAFSYIGTYDDEPFVIHDKPSFNEADVSDKPAYIRALSLISSQHITDMARHWRAGLECARSIDDAFQRMWNDLKATGRLQNTYFFLTTDNGLMRGEHRIEGGKIVPYQESINSTLFVWGPGIVPGKDNRHLVANIDFMPTFAQLAGLRVPAWVDGRSLVPLFRAHHQTAPSPWRWFHIPSLAFPIERCAAADQHPSPLGESLRHSADLLRSAHEVAAHAGEPACRRRHLPHRLRNANDITWRKAFLVQGLAGSGGGGGDLIDDGQEFLTYVTGAYVYTKYAVSADREFYDLIVDPYQLTNSWRALPPRFVDEIEARIKDLYSCVGESCRIHENSPSPSPSR